MSTQLVEHLTCDGCGQALDWGNILYRVWFTYEDGIDRHFHDFRCLRLWADAAERLRNQKLELAAKHRMLHVALDAAAHIDKDAWQAEHGIVESHPAEAVDNHLAQIGASANG